jgi:hypothetical protein
MNEYLGESKLLLWLMALVLIGFAFGCGDGGMNGRMFAGTQVTLDQNTVTQP